MPCSISSVSLRQQLPESPVSEGTYAKLDRVRREREQGKNPCWLTAHLPRQQKRYEQKNLSGAASKPEAPDEGLYATTRDYPAKT